MKKIIKKFILLIFCNAILSTSWVQAAQGDGTGGGGGDGITPGPNAPPGVTGEGPGLGVGPISMTKEKMNQLFDWAETTYPIFFPNHQDSIIIEGYYARYYPETDIYLGANIENRNIYVLGEPFNGLLNVGTFKELVFSSGI